jgi:hypothetical protein
MNILVIGYKHEALSAWSSIYLAETLKGIGADARAFLIDSNHIWDGMLVPVFNQWQVDVIISINYPRFCFGNEVGAIPTFITWIQDWCDWMTPENAKLWNSSKLNDWMVGYVDEAAGFDGSRMIHSPYFLPRNPHLDIQPKVDIAAAMGRGGTWMDYLRPYGKWLVDDDLRSRMSDLSVSILYGEIPPQMSILNICPEYAVEGFFEHIHLFGAINAMFRHGAVCNILSGDASFSIAGNNWEWTGASAGFISPQHILPFMATGKYVLHSSCSLGQHHRTALAFLSGRIPLIVANRDSKGSLGDVDTYLERQAEFLGLLLNSVCYGHKVANFNDDNLRLLGTPAYIKMTSLRRFKEWEERVNG